MVVGQLFVGVGVGVCSGCHTDMAASSSPLQLADILSGKTKLHMVS